MDNLVIVFGSVAGALIAVLSTAVGALVWFLKRLVDKTIPEQGQVFERSMMAQIGEMKAQREQCGEEHASQERANQQRHIEVMAAIRGREERDACGDPS